MNNWAGYRCGYGHISARTQATTVMKNTYVREARLLASLRARLADITGDDTALVDYLRTNGLMIVYLGPDWTIEERLPTTALVAGRADSPQLPRPIF
ncbi:hypothetical protein AB0L88_44905 [Saccharopolyspora shandongensis]|uniref:hypothetical protein n=1 Tax=Saccharopolyspora shandongensis TaxID=418495 RepID=UPI00343D5655